MKKNKIIIAISLIVVVAIGAFVYFSDMMNDKDSK